MSANEELAGHALRTLGIAFRSLPQETAAQSHPGAALEQGLVFLGLVGMIDPPREVVKLAAAQARGAGIRPIMITGDHPRTAVAIARELGIAQDGGVVTRAELQAMPDDTLNRTVRDVPVYARVNPEHKLRIVRTLQGHGATMR